ncbi:receptor-mediated endocytosis protein 6 homolog [Leptidea sinapis]|uniref:receptor-mediated endocytosis protein 6 homolog n=1 Tax=Leptidea sinapis TaxID=189913 RepID=UPI0021C3E7CF|nr:receptor-mediated endocytosis protein 6 homolog [Leptidea sinapis]
MMQPSTEGGLNIAELANRLRREKIFINSERQLIQTLNEELEKTTLELLQASWICTQERQNLTNLITSRSDAESIAACQRASLLEGSTFVDAFKVFKYKEASAVGELLGWLRETPHLMALCLTLGEDHAPPNLTSSLVAGLYGSCRSPDDRTRLLAVIRSLIKYQMVPSPDPRKLFRTNKNSLSSLFAVYRDGHTPARQFLVAALQAPVMAVLHEDEFFLDIDPDKAMERFSASDRLKKFGQANSTEYSAKVARYRKWTVQSLYNLTTKFISALRECWPTFPTTIAWIVQQIVHLLKKHSRSSEREVHAICTDLVLNQFICAAIVNPEAHGIIEIPVSYIARFNLIQIAQIIQMLCLARYQEVEPKVRDLYTKFERSCVWSLVEAVTSPQLGAAPAPPAGDAPLRTDVRNNTPVALFTRADLRALMTYLRRISSKLNNNTANGSSDEGQNGTVPTTNDLVNFGDTDTSASREVVDPSRNLERSDSTEGGEGVERLAALLQTLEPNYKARLHDLLRKVGDLSTVKTSPDNREIENCQAKRSLLAKVPKPRMARGNGSEERVEKEHLEPPEVLIIKLANVDEQDYLGLVPESKVLECYYGGSEAGDTEDPAALTPGPPAPVQKRTRFSVFHDEVSLGNTSDNLEAVSEAASNHSVTSSLELETEDQNDNLSDMVSANVSGRGSPNISGRETPSSQVTDGDAAGDQPVRRLSQNAPGSQATRAAQVKLLNQTRNEIDDKFCKFEIKKLLEGDETISIMSDTWSTDVLASDSETIGDTCDHANSHANTGSTVNNTNAPDVSETASESAWSIDVLASDSDRNTEVDTDDCVSVAARSDTSASWPHSAHAPAPTRAVQNGQAKRPEVNSPRHTPRFGMPNRYGGVYQSATATLSRGGELDLPSHSHAHHYSIENRKSILVNGYPVMTCYATSAPESPSTAPPMANDVFDYEPQKNSEAPPEGTVEAPGDAAVEGEGEADEQVATTSAGADATSQWVDDSFPRHDGCVANKYSADKGYEEHDMDRSLNSSESSLNAMSVSQYGRFEPGVEPPRPEPERSAIENLMTRMSAATISSNIVNNITSRIVKSELRTSVVNISSSRVDRKRDSSNVSLSTLSMTSETSASDRSSSQEVISDNVTERRISPPPKPSTGAIPKSISFDTTAEKSQRRRIVGEDGLVGNLDELKNNVKRSGGNLLHKIKMFRQKGRSHQQNDIKVCEEESPRCGEERVLEVAAGESSEEILAKYRRHSDGKTRQIVRRVSDLPDLELDRCEGVVDLNDPEQFNIMKRRLRTVLSSTDFHYVEYVPNRCTVSSLAEWIRAGNCPEAAATARALASAGTRAARLAAALRADLAARRPYAAYLASCRATLHHRRHELLVQLKQVRREYSECVRAAAAARVLDQLERGPALRRLTRQHHRTHDGGELMDERASRLTSSIRAVTAEVRADAGWEAASRTALDAADLAVERAVYARLYLHVLFPNGDGDISRDQVLSDHIRRLSACTSASRAGVSPGHLWAAPFPHAQLLLRQLPVYRTPRDKVSCVMRCVSSLMSVLSLTDGTPPAADDLTPALVLVIIKVNPPSLLSTIELVNALAGAVLAGEALYWWTQFCAAVAYIKSMEYRDT